MRKFSGEMRGFQLSHTEMKAQGGYGLHHSGTAHTVDELELCFSAFKSSWDVLEESGWGGACLGQGQECC